MRRWLVRTIRPTWTAGSVAILERDDGRWLFVKPVYRKGWTLPGGLVDKGEHPAVSAVREMREELGVTVEVIDGPWVVVDPEHSRLETIYRVAATADTDLDAIAITTVELSDLGWYAPDTPPDLEDETSEVIALARENAAGGVTVRVKGEHRS